LGLGFEDFVEEFAAFEEDGGALCGWNVLGSTVLVYLEFAAVGQEPIGVEVADDGELSGSGVAKLVYVFSIKAAFFKKGIMKLIARDAGIAGCVEVLHKGVYLGKEFGFVWVVVGFVEP